MLTSHGENYSNEPLGDVAAAMELVRTLRTVEEPTAPEAWDTFHRVDPRELLQGLDTLIPALTSLLDDPADMVIPLVRRLRELELACEDFLPTAAAVLTAAALGQSPRRWRAQFGRVDAAEMAVWAHTAAQLADLVDRTAGAGAATRLMNRAFGGLADEQP